MSRASGERAVDEADQLELQALIQGNAALESSLLDDLMVPPEENELDSFNLDVSQVAREDLGGAALEEVQWRIRILGNGYPFELNGANLSYVPRRTRVYEFLLLTALEDHTRNKGEEPVWSKNSELMFELIAFECVKLYFGGGGLRTGFPSHDVRERPKRFRDVSALLQREAPEWLWIAGDIDSDAPYLRLFTDEQKDATVDFVVWRKLDERPGALYAVGQCACGQNWKTKLRELSIKRLQAWWQLPPVDPIRTFAIPRVIDASQPLKVMTLEAGLVFDRLRLTLLAEAAPDDHPLRCGWLPPMSTYIKNWAQDLVTRPTRPAKPSPPPRTAAAAPRSQ